MTEIFMIYANCVCAEGVFDDDNRRINRDRKKKKRRVHNVVQKPTEKEINTKKGRNTLNSPAPKTDVHSYPQ